jgi:hypothetical protein
LKTRNTFRRLARVAKLTRKRKSASARLSSALKHPAALLILGFLLTGGVGTVVTSCVQNRHWQKQQDFTAKQEETEAKLQLMRDTLAALAKHFAAQQDVVLAYDWGLKFPFDNAELLRRSAERSRQISQWQAEKEVLRARLRSRFQCEAVPLLFDDIARASDELSNNVTYILVNSHGLPIHKDYSSKELISAYMLSVAAVKHLKGNEGDLDDLARLMLGEIKEASVSAGDCQRFANAIKQKQHSHASDNQ